MDQGTSQRPLALRARQDLAVERHVYQQRVSYLVKDPIALRYFRFEPEEYSLLRALDGQATPEQIKQQFEREFAPQRLSYGELQQFIGRLHRSGLVISDTPGQGVELWKRQRQQRDREQRQRWLSWMSWRFRGINPNRGLTLLNHWCGWIFSGPAVALAGLIALSALLLIFTEFETFQANLPSFQEFFAGKNWLWLAVVLSLTKICHELGHGLACKRWGSECNEMGLMLLIFTPCLYCNVSDSWMLPSKWRRMAISAAGMYVELVLASVATWIWWFSHPGLVHQLALNVMFVCSVTTLLFNANPLMRYDGYYILSDWLEIPNLRQKANQLLQQTAARWCLGLPTRTDPFLPQRRRWLFVTFSLAAFVYRWIITFSIGWFLYQVLEPYGFKIVGQMLAALMIAMAIGGPVFSLVRFFRVPGRWSAVQQSRLTLTAIGLAAVILGILAIPLPHYVNCVCYVQPQAVEYVYVEIPGSLAEILVQPGQRVVAGDPLAKLASPEIEDRILQMERAEKIAEAQVQVVNYLVRNEPLASGDVNPAEAENAWRVAQSKLKQRRRDLERLEIVAPRTGTFLPAAPRTNNDQADEVGQLRTWEKTPLDSQNLGAWLETQTLLGQIVPHDGRFEAILAIDQADVEFIRAGQVVKLWLRQLPGKNLRAETTQISPTKMKAVPRQLSIHTGGDLPTVRTAQGLEEPASPTFQVAVPLTEEVPHLMSGAVGIAKVHVGSQTLGGRLWRLACQTFRLEM